MNARTLPEAQAALLLQTLERQRAAFLAEQPVSLAQRTDRLRRAIAMVLRHADRFIEASQQDFPHRPPELARLTEVFFPLEALRHAEKHVAQWMKPQRRGALFPFNLFGARAEIQWQPLGVVGVVAPWNAALTLLLLPLAPILSAGNRAFLRPSDQTPHCGDAAAAAIREYFDPTEVAVALGGADVSVAFTGLPFDHLLFTGSTPVGRVVAQAAAPHLTPVTLELGGKCPVYVLDDADLPATARRLAFGKLLNGGQACLSPDTVFVPPQMVQPLLAAMDAEVRLQLPAGPDDVGFCGLLNARQFDRVASLVDEAVALGTQTRVLGAGGDTPQAARRPERCAMAPVVLIDPPAQARASREEIFGPVMVLRTCTDLQATLAAQRQLDKPLGLYVFSGNAASAQQVLDGSFSGGVTVNDTAMHFSVPDLPFGGVGHSGVGAYGMGEEGFRRFSHPRAVYKQAGPYALMRAMRPPYGRLYQQVFVKGLQRLEKRYADVQPLNPTPAAPAAEVVSLPNEPHRG